MGYQNILVEREDKISIITLNRPQALNALSLELLQELSTALSEIDRDEEIRVAIITGTAKVFSAGADVKEMKDTTAIDMMLGKFADWERVARTKKPLIAAVSGYTFGGGNELAMMCDIIVASETAKFAQPEIMLGIIPGAGGTQRLTKVVGKYKAMELILTGRQFSAEEAYALGLVNKVVPEDKLLEEAKKIAREIAILPPIAVRLAKEAILKSFTTYLEEGLEFERKCFYLLANTEDKREGITAFMEKRQAQFKGR